MRAGGALVETITVTVPDAIEYVPTHAIFAGCSMRSIAFGEYGVAGESVMRTAFVAGLIATLSNVPASSVRYRPSGAM